MVLVAVAIAILEMLAAALVLLLLQLIVDPSGSLGLPLVGDIRQLVPGDADGQIITLTILLGAFFLFHGLASIGATYFQQRAAHKAAAGVSRDLFSGYLSLPYVFHFQTNSAGIIRNSYDAVQKLGSHVFLPAINIVAEALVLVALFAFLLVSAPVATSIVMAIFLPLILGIIFIINPRIKRLGRRAHRTSGEAISMLQQTLEGIRDVVLLRARHKFVKAYSILQSELARALYLRGTAGDLPRRLLQTAFLLSILAFLAVSVSSEGAASETLTLLGLIAYAGLRMQPSLQKLIISINNLKFSSALLMDIQEDMARFAQEKLEVPTGTGNRQISFTSALVLDRVTYSYEPSALPAIDSINLTISKGMRLGICGPTGGGKSTLIDIIIGLIPPTTGLVTVDGIDIHSRLEAWWDLLGVVSQHVFLLDDSLMRNVAFGVPDGEIDEVAVKKAVEVAQLSEFVAQLPHGLGTRVGERGTRLSGGQRQRVAIARALYREPEILVLDEGTSALDGVTESELMAAIEASGEGRTLILVAHRLTTLKTCDLIVFVDEGQITARGTHDQLFENHPPFSWMSS